MLPDHLKEQLTKAREAKVRAVKSQSAVAEAVQADQVAADARNEVMQSVADWLDGPIEDAAKPDKPKGKGKQKPDDTAGQGEQPAGE